MDCSLPGPSVHGIFQARVLEWVAIAFSAETLGKEQKTLCKRLLMKHYHDKGFLGWLNGGMAPPPLLLELPWINTLSLNNGTFGNLLRTPEKFGTWTRHFTETCRGHSNYFFCCNRSYFIQGRVPLPFVIAIGSLQFNKTLRSITCINCKLYTCLAIATAKSLQLCPTLCDPIDGSPPGFPIPGIIQARTLECVAISFSNT